MPEIDAKELDARTREYKQKKEQQHNLGLSHSRFTRWYKAAPSKKPVRNSLLVYVQRLNATWYTWYQLQAFSVAYSSFFWFWAVMGTSSADHPITAEMVTVALTSINSDVSFYHYTDRTGYLGCIEPFP